MLNAYPDDNLPPDKDDSLKLFLLIGAVFWLVIGLLWWFGKGIFNN